MTRDLAYLTSQVKRTKRALDVARGRRIKGETKKAESKWKIAVARCEAFIARKHAYPLNTQGI